MPKDTFAISIVVAAELRYGAILKASPKLSRIDGVRIDGVRVDRWGQSGSMGSESLIYGVKATLLSTHAQRIVER